MQNIHSFLLVPGCHKSIRAGVILCVYGLAATFVAAGTRWIPGEDIVAYANGVNSETESDEILPVVYEKAEFSNYSDVDTLAAGDTAEAAETSQEKDAGGSQRILDEGAMVVLMERTASYDESYGVAEETEQVAQIPLEEKVMTIADESSAAMQEELAEQIAAAEIKARKAKEEARRQKELEANRIHLSDLETQILCRIVEAEATGEDVNGKMLVANVVLNRVNNSSFPDNVEDVVFAPGQFSPIKDGRYYSVSITDTTRQAVERVLNGEDASRGALYFMSRQGADRDNAAWFDSHLYWLFNYGCHDFYK